MTFSDELRNSIEECSMQIVGLLGDQYPQVRVACVRLVCSPSGYGETLLPLVLIHLTPLPETLDSRIKDIIPRVGELLVDVSLEVRSATANALIPWTTHSQWLKFSDIQADSTSSSVENRD
jgi:hypothetical protein